ncbi:MAG: hypothetical protein DGJ47_000754 [Rickettsiaceae bacterium]
MLTKSRNYYKELSIIVDCTNKGNCYLQKYTSINGKTLGKINITSLSNNKIIAVIGGGMSAEHEVSYMSSNGIVDSLINLGHRVIFIDMGADISSVLQKIKPQIVYNGLHGTYGEDGCLQGLLNILKIKYTGPGVLSSSVAMNKKKSYEILRSESSITIPESIIIHKNHNLQTDPMPRPYVIKPLSQGSSVGIEVVFAEDDFTFDKYDFPYGDEVIIDQYIKGQEIQVAVLNGKALGVLEIKMLGEKRFYDYEAKYTEGFAKHIYPASIPKKAYNDSLKAAEKACKIFECMNGIIRVEFLYQEQEKKLYMLELNTHPGMTPLSICPEISSHQGISYTQLVEKVLSQAKYEE